MTRRTSNDSSTYQKHSFGYLRLPAVYKWTQWINCAWQTTFANFNHERTAWRQSIAGNPQPYNSRTGIFPVSTLKRRVVLDVKSEQYVARMWHYNSAACHNITCKPSHNMQQLHVKLISKLVMRQIRHKIRSSITIVELMNSRHITISRTRQRGPYTLAVKYGSGTAC